MGACAPVQKESGARPRNTISIIVESAAESVRRMPFSTRVKSEAAQVRPNERLCLQAELAGLLHAAGRLHLEGGSHVALEVVTENGPVARKVFWLLKQFSQIPAEIKVFRGQRLQRRSSVFRVSLRGGGDVLALLREIGVLDPSGRPLTRVDPAYRLRRERRAAYLRGAFLGQGSVTDPNKGYHLELLTQEKEYAKQLLDLLRRSGIRARVAERRGYAVYVKDADGIGEFLGLIGAHGSFLDWENIRVQKNMRNQINREVNCETANVDKAVDAAMRQAEDIRFIAERLGLENLPKPLRQMAEARLEHPEATLRDLGDLLDPPLGKSGVNYRLRKLETLARLLRGE